MFEVPFFEWVFTTPALTMARKQYRVFTDLVMAVYKVGIIRQMGGGRLCTHKNDLSIFDSHA